MYSIESRSIKGNYDVSVVTPTLNAETLSGVINSVSIQRSCKVELVLVDDASLEPLRISDDYITVIRMC